MRHPAHPGLQLFLRRLLLRSPLADEEQRAVLGLRVLTQEVEARRELVTPGETVDYACLAAEGLLGRFDQMRDGSRQITALYIPGDMCDLHSVVAPVSGWGIMTLSPGRVLRVPHADLREIATRYPGLALAFWRDTTADASILAKWIANIGRKDAQARLAHLLCEMGLRMELAGLGARASFRFEATQEQIGDALGLTPVHVNRVLRVLRTQGVATVRNRTVEIHDWASLTAIAEFVPAFLLLDESALARRDADLSDRRAAFPSPPGS